MTENLYRALVDLVISILDVGEMHRWAHLVGGEELRNSIPLNASAIATADQLVLAITKRGCMANAFEQLAELRPHRKDEISSVRLRWAAEPGMQEALRRLEGLIFAEFDMSSADLLRLFAFVPGFEPSADGGAPPASRVRQLIDRLLHQGPVDHHFLDALFEARPNAAGELKEIAQMMKLSWSPEERVVSRSRSLGLMQGYQGYVIELLAKERASAMASGRATVEIDRALIELEREARTGPILRPWDRLLEERYTLVEHIGSGGFGTVWRGQEYLGRGRSRPVAVKVLHDRWCHKQQDNFDRFFRGARCMAELASPDVVTIFEPQCIDRRGYCFFVMEFMGGGDLRQAIISRRVSPRQGLEFLTTVANGLSSAHKSGLVHRDVKPDNILLGSNYSIVKIADFDLVFALDESGGTQTQAIGSLVYAAPEALVQGNNVTAVADVYSLAMTAVFCLNNGDLPAKTLLREAPSFIASLDASRRIRGILLRALAWEPHLRMQSVGEFAEELRSALSPASHSMPLLLSRRTVQDGDLGGLADSLSLQFVDVPAGRFSMGSPTNEPGRNDGEDLHLVSVSAFRIARGLITQRVWSTVMGENPSYFKGEPELPVERISWNDAIRFTNVLSLLYGLECCYQSLDGDVIFDSSKTGFRLPTEAQWEYACRAGNGSPWCFGDDSAQLANFAWYRENSSGRTHCVGTRDPNPLNLFDMHGNLWEWCWDRLGNYKPDQVDPQGPDQGDRRVLRGGSWSHSARSARSAFRFGDGPDVRSLWLGCRLVLPAWSVESEGKDE